MLDTVTLRASWKFDRPAPAAAPTEIAGRNVGFERGRLSQRPRSFSEDESMNRRSVEKRYVSALARSPDLSIRQIADVTGLSYVQVKKGALVPQGS